MNDMTKHQLVLLILLVSFVTALVTGIVAVTLINQAPPPITQTIQRVVEKTIGALPEPLKKDEKKELETSALARDVLIEDIARRISQAVVSVVATKDIPVIEQYFINPFPGDDFFGDVRIPQFRQRGTEKRQISSGSGFFVSPDGFLLTNKHVVEDTDAEYSIILNDGRKMKTRVVARDSLNDMAVLKADGSGFPAVPFGDSDSAKVGHTVIVIGNALGEFQNTVSVGVVSGLRRTITASGPKAGPEELAEVMQTDAAINPGNSGGPVLNLRGEVVGLSVAMAAGAENIGFALPINSLKKAFKSAKETGKITYPYLGVRYTMVTPEIKEKKKLPVDYGALVTPGQAGEAAILPDSPAAKAGIKEGDIVLEFGRTKVNKDNTLAKLIQQKNIGDKINIKLMRDSKESSLEVTLEERK